MEPRVVADRYELTEPLGASSWRAVDTELGREVLVRFRPPGPAAGLSHPNIRRVFDHGVEDGEPYEVLEYAVGGTLADVGELPAGAAAALVGALAYAHAQGITHGAIAADNILFDADGNAKLSGFTGSGDPDADSAALEEVLGAYPVAAAPATAPTVVVPPPEDATLIRRAAAATPPPRRGRGAAVAAVAAALVLAGLAAAYVTASSDDAPPPTTGDDFSLPVPTTTAELPTESEPESPPTTTEPETTTQATTETRPTTSAPATTAPPPTTVPPPPTVEPPPPTVEPPPPTTEPPAPPTEPAPPTTTEEAPETAP